MCKRSGFLTIAVVLTLLFQPSYSGEQVNHNKTNNVELEVLSHEQVELHIGLMEERQADHFPLEMAFLSQYPNGKIVYHLFDSDQLSVYLLGGESAIDLLVLTNRSTANYAEKGGCVDFYSTPLLSEWPRDWIDIRQQAETEGKLYGFPKQIDLRFFGWNESLAKKAGVNKPDYIWTWDEFRDICQTIPFDADGDGVKEYLLMRGYYHVNGLSGYVDDFLEQYAYEHALENGSIQTPEFEYLNQLFINVLDSGALGSMRGVVPVYDGEEALLISIFSANSTAPLTGEQYSFLPYPTLNADNPGYVGWLYSYSLLHNAPHPDLAINFLSNALNPDIQIMATELTQSFVKTLPNYIVFNEAISLFEAFAPDEQGAMTYTVTDTSGYSIYPLADIFGEISGEVFEAYQQMREHLLPNTGDWYELAILWYELIPHYMSGDLPFSELSLALDNRMTMMQGE